MMSQHPQSHLPGSHWRPGWKRWKRIPKPASVFKPKGSTQARASSIQMESGPPLTYSPAPSTAHNNDFAGFVHPQPLAGLRNLLHEHSWVVPRAASLKTLQMLPHRMANGNCLQPSIDQKSLYFTHVRQLFPPNESTQMKTGWCSGPPETKEQNHDMESAQF